MENGQNLAAVTPGDSAGSKPLRRTRYGDPERFVQELLSGQSLKAAYGAAGYVGHPLFANMNSIDSPTTRIAESLPLAPPEPGSTRLRTAPKRNHGSDLVRDEVSEG
jgi:hypothetical protein